MNQNNILSKESLLYLKAMIEAKKDVTCILAVTSKVSNIEYFYKITGVNSNNNYFINIYYRDSSEDFVKCAFKVKHGLFLLSAYAETTCPNVLGARWFFSTLLMNNIDVLINKVEVKHTGNCLICNRKLTDPLSIEIGIGEVCNNKLNN